MTEKRFTFADGFKIVAIRDNGEIMNSKQVCEKLNELYGENQDHKAMIEFLDTENTQIMNELKTRTQIQHQLEEENEQLKQLIKKTLETTPIEHTLAMELKNSVRELYD